MNNTENEPDLLPENLTIPINLQFSARAFADEDHAKKSINKLHSVLSVISQSIDLSNLDGVTIAFDYDNALAELDRGYETNFKLTATKDVAVGVAMAPSVIRNGKIKTHLVLNANYVLNILDEPGQETDYFWQSLHTVAHECAHVEVTAAFDKSFPGHLLQKAYNNILDNMRWQVILAIWDEYAVCRIVGSIGHDPAPGYLETLVQVLENTRNHCFELIKAYRTHGDVGQVVTEVYGKLGDLLKYSSYFLGAVAAHENPNTHPITLTKVEEFEWFRPFYESLIEMHAKLWQQFGKWENQVNFEALGDHLEKIAENIGIEASRQSREQIHFNIPYRSESMPD
jgi:hypothetical protein